MYVQKRLKMSDYFKPHYNNTMRGIKYPCVITWKKKERDGVMVPVLSWKCNMYVSSILIRI